MITEKEYIENITRFTEKELAPVWKAASLDYTHGLISRQLSLIPASRELIEKFSSLLTQLSKEREQYFYNFGDNVFVNTESGSVFLSQKDESNENEILVGSIEELYNLCDDEIYDNDNDVHEENAMNSYIVDCFFPRYEKLGNNPFNFSKA